jgi:hypothetical protein
MLLAGTAFALPAAANAAAFTSDHCDPLCGPQPGGFATITGTEITGGVSVTIHFLNGNSLQGGTSGLTSFTFNSLQNQAITFDFGLLNSQFDVSNSTSNTANAGSIMQDGFGQFEYGFNYIAPGGSQPFTQDLTFTLTGTGLTLASFNELSVVNNPANAAYLALDIKSGLGGVGNTGVVDCCAPGVTPFFVPGPVVGAGLPGILMACAGLFGFNWRRKRNQGVTA